MVNDFQTAGDASPALIPVYRGRRGLSKGCGSVNGDFGIAFERTGAAYYRHAVVCVLCIPLGVAIISLLSAIEPILLYVRLSE